MTTLQKMTIPLAPWERASVTKMAFLFISVGGTAMFLIAIAAAYVPDLNMPAYVPLAIIQGTWGWGGYFLSRLCHWEHPLPKAYKPFQGKVTATWFIIGGVLIFVLQALFLRFVQLTVETFLIGAYIVLAAICETQFFHIALPDVGAAIGALIARKISTMRTRLGEFIGRIAMIIPSTLLFTSLHGEYAGDAAALSSVFALGLSFCIMYAISDNTESVFLLHIIWNVLRLIQTGGVTV
jgi:membrane protease YdiL (CAAX protease family)